MSWTDSFPVLSDEMVDAWQRGATEEEKEEYDEWFSVDRIINRRKAKHIVAFSLFWKQSRTEEGELPPLDRETLMKAGHKGLVKRFAPWEHYVAPLLKGAVRLGESRPDVVFRVYLAADLHFLINDFTDVGCEVFLMRSSSIRHNPGAMWRFLALEEKGMLVTISDSDRAPMVEADIQRSELMSKTGLGFWRLPVWGDWLNHEGMIFYRPVLGCQFGSRQALPSGLLMRALTWHTRRGTIPVHCTAPGCGEQPVFGTNWPDYGFDEWFLLAAVYPRVAFRGVLSFVDAAAKSRILPLDIEFCTWANPKSEIAYFGGGGGCCGPAPSVTVKSRHRIGTQRVLLTGFWTLATKADVALMRELHQYAMTQDQPVDCKPVIHVVDESLLSKLPVAIRKAAVLWHGLAADSGVKRSLLDAVSQGHRADWIWETDHDERADFASAGGLRKVLVAAHQEGADFLPAEWVDRIPVNPELPILSASKALSGQFPFPVLATECFGQAHARKIVLRRRNCALKVGSHECVDRGKRPVSVNLPVWRFCWHRDRLQPVLPGHPDYRARYFSWELQQIRAGKCVASMPRTLWPLAKRPISWERKAAYPCR